MNRLNLIKKLHNKIIDERTNKIDAIERIHAQVAKQRLLELLPAEHKYTLCIAPEVNRYSYAIFNNGEYALGGNASTNVISRGFINGAPHAVLMLKSDMSDTDRYKIEHWSSRAKQFWLDKYNMPMHYVHIDTVKTLICNTVVATTADIRRKLIKQSPPDKYKGVKGDTWLAIGMGCAIL